MEDKLKKSGVEVYTKLLPRSLWATGIICLGRGTYFWNISALAVGKNLDEQPRWRQITWSTKAWDPVHTGDCPHADLPHPAPWYFQHGHSSDQGCRNSFLQLSCKSLSPDELRHNLKKCKPSYNVFILFLQGRLSIFHPLLSLITCSYSWYWNQNIFAWKFYQFMYQNFFLAKTSLFHLVSTERQTIVTETRRVKSRLDKLLLDLIRLNVLFWIWKPLFHGISDFKSSHLTWERLPGAVCHFKK